MSRGKLAGSPQAPGVRLSIFVANGWRPDRIGAAGTMPPRATRFRCLDDGPGHDGGDDDLVCRDLPRPGADRRGRYAAAQGDAIQMPGRWPWSRWRRRRSRLPGSPRPGPDRRGRWFTWPRPVRCRPGRRPRMPGVQRSSLVPGLRRPGLPTGLYFLQFPVLFVLRPMERPI